ncbi:tRNA wybutosine-synthesizing protein 4 [Candida viswanathii]|uniref:tRNA wybutosine-synthesizing protein 4 n=1 Tax=Candida viswanathii TaxID=5486 RepID=A0A367XQD7_9ASCO|nr:tRNA wybutosine-synthesizing protein 4 [Candida viswanathii]
MTTKLTPEQLARQKRKIEKDKRKKVYDDQQVQGTNNSSIVSKRSVEKLYSLALQPELGEFFKYFVPKGKRRSPAINRGYWIRMELIRQMVIRIIDKNVGKRVNVVNLGCGFDPLAFQLLNVYKERNDLNFIDIDYPDLVKNKYDMIQKAEEIKELIGDQRSSDLECLISTDHYKLVGCDLKHADKYQEILDKLVTDKDNVNIFIAEVSLAYMKPIYANSIIEISSKVNNSHFLILEQIMPDGPNNSFAKKMLYHFNHLRSPIQCVENYSTKELQLARFKEYYEFAEIKNLFENWKYLIEYDMKEKISRIEEFDEWEEFIIFCQHYIIVHACNIDQIYDVENEEPQEDMYTVDESFSVEHDDRFDDEQFELKFPATSSIGSKVYVNGGLKQTRNDETLVVDLDNGRVTQLEKAGVTPSARMCHSFTNINDGLVLIGGRSRPGQYFSDAYKLASNEWTKLADLPSGRSRHSAVAVSDHQILIFGGLQEGSDEDVFLLYDIGDDAYKPLKVVGVNPGNLKSASMDYADFGLILGGISDLNIPEVNDKLYKFTINHGDAIIHVQEIFQHKLLARIGSKFKFVTKDKILIVGGVSPFQLFTKEANIVSLSLTSFEFGSVEIPENIRETVPPIFVGFELVESGDAKSLFIVGGGAVCYSFGSCYNSLYKIVKK